jgi:predicted RNA-binding Zn ribbon-like protein
MAHMSHAHSHDIPLPKHEFLAGRLALDFCNSLSRADSALWGPAPRDRIARPRDFLAWADRRGIALDHAPSGPALKRLHRLRLALFAIFDALCDDTAPRAADLALLNEELAEARAAELLVTGRKGYRLAAPTAGIDGFRHDVARDAADLLLGDRRRVKRCPNHECQWLFHDTSKNLSRRWCAMDDCGTRDKVRRFRARS